MCWTFSSKARKPLFPLLFLGTFALAPLFAGEPPPDVQPDASVTISTEAPKINAPSFQEVLDAGLSAMMEKDDKKAIQLFEQALTIKPEDPTAKRTLDSIRRRLGPIPLDDTKTQEEEFLQITRMARGGQFILASTQLKSYLLRYPDDKKAKKLSAKICKEADYLLKGEEPDSYFFYLLCGISPFLDGNYDEAVIFWKKASKKNPDDHFLKLALRQAETYLHPHDPLLADPVPSATSTQETETRQSTYSQENPDLPFLAAGTEPSPAIDEAIKAVSRNDYPAAIAALKELLEMKPGDTGAENLLKKTIEKQELEASRHYQRGLFAYATGDLTKALEAWQTVLKIDPKHSKTRKILPRAFFGRR